MYFVTKLTWKQICIPGWNAMTPPRAGNLSYRHELGQRSCISNTQSSVMPITTGYRGYHEATKWQVSQCCSQVDTSFQPCSSAHACMFEAAW